MATDHKVTVRDLIKNQGLNVPDSEIYTGPLQSHFDDLCIAMFDISSEQPDSFFEDNERWRFPEIQIRIRGPEEKLDEVQSDAEDVYDLVDNKKPSGYLKTEAMRSNPFYLEQDEDGRHHYTVQCRLQIIE